MDEASEQKDVTVDFDLRLGRALVALRRKFVSPHTQQLLVRYLTLVANPRGYKPERFPGTEPRRRFSQSSHRAAIVLHDTAWTVKALGLFATTGEAAGLQTKLERVEAHAYRDWATAEVLGSETEGFGLWYPPKKGRT